MGGGFDNSGPPSTKQAARPTTTGQGPGHRPETGTWWLRSAGGTCPCCTVRWLRGRGNQIGKWGGSRGKWRGGGGAFFTLLHASCSSPPPPLCSTGGPQGETQAYSFLVSPHPPSGCCHHCQSTLVLMLMSRSSRFGVGHHGTAISPSHPVYVFGPSCSHYTPVCPMSWDMSLNPKPNHRPPHEQIQQYVKGPLSDHPGAAKFARYSPCHSSNRGKGKGGGQGETLGGRPGSKGKGRGGQVKGVRGGSRRHARAHTQSSINSHSSS